MIGCYCNVCTSTDPRDNRTRSSVILIAGNTTVVIDTGPDFRQQILREKINQLDAVIFTHSHKDHIAGMDDIRPFNYLKGKVIDVYAEEKVQQVLQREYKYVFDSDYPGIPRIKMHSINERNDFKVGDIFFTPIRAMHMDMPVLGFRTGNFAYLTDASYIPAIEMHKMLGLEVLVINALRIEKHYSHFNFEEALDIVAALKPAQTYLTHISHHLGLHREIEEMCPEGVLPGYDGLTFDVNL